ncbi:MAG TPA: aminotransferase class I/II-fold pyridoxal phosphate-dependent enzyme, partial [Dehalococcoidia bacterium]|nr:aminotransferase class I/II-fold pyridoxal phosphate-dependent enzyme [Dehalococcoidia bacterium]
MSERVGIERLVKSGLVNFKGYSARESAEALEGELTVPVEGVIKLDANENPYGCSPKVNRALEACPDLNIYPDAAQTELRKLLAGYTGVGVERIVAGSGSGDLIDLLLRLLIEPGDEVVACVPAFSMFRFSTRMYGGRLVEVPRDKDFSVTVSAVKAAISKKTKLILLDNPNNPSGNVTPQPDIMEIADIGLPLLVDEAYVEFSGETVLPIVSQYQNLMVLRTFSKWAGLAGLRVGYGIFPPEMAAYLMTIKLPYNVNVAAIVAVRESLNDIDYLMGNVRAIIAERERLLAELRKLRFLTPYPSQANFILCSVRDGLAAELQRRLK